MSGKIICIEGNIGAGKSTLLQNLAKRGIPVFQEDLNAWGHFLDLFYKDQQRWSFTLQTAIMNSSAEQYQQMKKLCEKHDFIFVERSMDTCMVFAAMAHLKKYITAQEYVLLDSLYEKIRWKPDFRIYLDADVFTCMRRIRQRGRSCEQNITTDYLLAIQNCYKSIPMDRRIDADSDNVLEETMNIANRLVRGQSYEQIAEDMLVLARQIASKERSTV